MILAENAPTVHTYAALDQVDTPVTLVAVRGDLRAAKELDFCHRQYKMRGHRDFAKATLH